MRKQVGFLEVVIATRYTARNPSTAVTPSPSASIFDVYLIADVNEKKKQFYNIQRSL